MAIKTLHKEDIGFFAEVQGVLENKRIATRLGKTGSIAVNKEKKEKGAKTSKEKGEKIKALLPLTAEPLANPCNGCPLEPKAKRMKGAGDLATAKLLVVVEKITEKDLVENTYAKYDQFLPILKEQGFKKEDVYFTALTRSFTSQENLEAVERCSHYLRAEILQPNIKCILILGLRPFQLLVDAKRNTIFKARGQIFSILGKPALVTFEKVDS